MSKWPTTQLGDVVIARPGNGKIIKGTLPTANNGRLFPAYSATGQDVFSEEYDHEGDGIVVSAVGARCGKCFLATGRWRAIANTHVLLPRKERVVAQFLWYLINNENFWVKGGTAQPFVKIKDSLKTTIPLPPLAEQERIVRILDEVEALRRLHAQADERIGDITTALFDEMFGGERGEALGRVNLGELSEVVSGVTKGRKFNGRQTIEVPYLRVANVQAGRVDLSELKTIEALPEEVDQLVLRKGDVLLTEGGDFDKLGRGAMWEHNIPNCIHQNHIFRVRVDQSILDPVFLARFLLTHEARSYFLGCAKRTTNLASINMSQLRSLPVPLPTLTDQRTFAARVAEIRELEATQAASRKRLGDLFQCLLHRAFQGEL